MAFDASGKYIPESDCAVRMVLLVTKDHVGPIGRQSGFMGKMHAGEVILVATMGHTNVASAPMYRNPDASAVWIEHAEAVPGDVLPESEWKPLVADAEKKLAAVKAFHATLTKSKE